MKTKITIITLLLITISTLNIFADEPVEFKHIFDVFYNHREFYEYIQTTLTNPEEAEKLDYLRKLEFYQVGFGADIENNLIWIFDNENESNYFEISNTEIGNALVKYVKEKFLTETDYENTEITYLKVNQLIMMKVDPTTCGIFGNDYYVTLDFYFEGLTDNTAVSDHIVKRIIEYVSLK